MTDNKENDSWNVFFSDLAKFREVQERQKQRGLNDFTSLGSVLKANDEVRLHTRFIYSLLNPEGKHYQGTRFLELFLECIGRSNWLNIDSTIVRKEYCPDGKSEQIDLYIADGSREIVIENKLNAHDQPRQVLRYLDAVDARHPESSDNTLFVYLTKGRAQPSLLGLGQTSNDKKPEANPDSRHLIVCKKTSSLLNENGRPVALYQNLWYRGKPKSMSVHGWLESCSREVEGKDTTSNILWAISDYKTVVERATREYASNVKTLKEFFEGDGKEHLEQALQLTKDLPNAQIKWLHSVMTEQLDELFEAGISAGYLLKLDAENASDLVDFVRPGWKKKPLSLLYEHKYNYFNPDRSNTRDRGVFYLVTKGPFEGKVVLTLFYGRKALHAGYILREKSIDEKLSKSLEQPQLSEPKKLSKNIFPLAMTLSQPLDSQGTVNLAAFKSSPQRKLFEQLMNSLEIPMNYDPAFDQARLDQLAEQHLDGSNITGRVLFFSESEDNQLDYATWQFEDKDQTALKGSDFKLHLMELLNTLLVYRAQHNQPNTSQGVVNVDGDQLSIEWLPKSDAEALRTG